jgi:hypothetical protein
VAGALLLASLSAFSLGGGETAPAFVGEVAGEITAHPTGEARFGTVDGGGSVPSAFTVSLGADGQEGSILFTRNSGAALGMGSYTITDGDGDGDAVRALVMTGSATHPTGVFRGQSGELVITSVTESTMTGTFRVSASGFLAASPDVEDRPVIATGWFRASGD